MTLNNAQNKLIDSLDDQFATLTYLCDFKHPDKYSKVEAGFYSLTLSNLNDYNSVSHNQLDNIYDYHSTLYDDEPTLHVHPDYFTFGLYSYSIKNQGIIKTNLKTKHTTNVSLCSWAIIVNDILITVSKLFKRYQSDGIDILSTFNAMYMLAGIGKVKSAKNILTTFLMNHNVNNASNLVKHDNISDMFNTTILYAQHYVENNHRTNIINKSLKNLSNCSCSLFYNNLTNVLYYDAIKHNVIGLEKSGYKELIDTKINLVNQIAHDTVKLRHINKKVQKIFKHRLNSQNH